MSGGRFQYQQHVLHDIADDIARVINDNKSTEIDRWGEPVGRNYSPEVITKMQEGVKALKIAYVYAHRIDWLLSDDDGEESFLKRLEKELREI